MSFRIGNMRTSLVLLNIDIGPAYLGVSGEFQFSSMGNMRTILFILNIDRGPAYLGVSGEFQNGEYADQSGYPQHRQRSVLPWSVW